MIEEYFEDKKKQVKREKLLAWKQFYLDCNNEWLASKVDKQLEKL